MQTEYKVPKVVKKKPFKAKKKQFQRYADKGIEVIGFLDIETKTDDFKAQNGYILTWVLKQYNIRTNKSITYEMALDKEQNILEDPTEFYDEHLLTELVKTMKECDYLVLHYGCWFDIPFIRTRCQMFNLDFVYHEDKIRFADTWKMARMAGSFKGNGLDNVGKTLKSRDNKTHIDYVEWKKAYKGDKKAIAYILDHNEKDVKITEAIWRKMERTFPISGRYY